MDGVVTSVLRTGFFVDCGSLQAFVGRNVRTTMRLMQVPVH
jgi:DNA-directed RNA polymerase II subunit RPB7